MSASKDELFDLEQAFLPAWAKQPATENRFANYQGGGGREDRGRGDFRDRPPGRRDQPREGGPRGPRPQGQGRPPFGGDRRDRPPRGGDRDFGERRPPAPPPQPLPEVNVAIVAEAQGVDSLTRQIRVGGRCYPLFDIAQLVLAKPERYTVTISVRKSPEGAVIQPLFVCALDESLWLSLDEAVAWALDKHFNLFYQPEKTQIEPPKGTYTFVGQCGISGVILGPPNHHDYQNRLRRLHQERFARMPFEMFKSRVRIVRDEAVVKKWVEEQSFRTEYVCLNIPEPLRLSSREEVEKHFRETHAPTIIKEVEKHELSGPASRNLRSSGLMRLVRQAWEDQRHFPLQLATILSQQFASRGLQFFKVNRTVTHVAVARPRHLDLDAAPVSDGVRRIVTYIDAHTKCTRKQMLDALAPAPAVIPVAPAAVIPVAIPAAPAVENAVAPAPVEGVAAETPVAPVTPAPAPAARLETPERTAILSDLHWLIHQGHVLEFANGRLETAKKPLPKPVKAAPKNAPGVPAAAPTGASSAEAEAAADTGQSEGTVVGEVVTLAEPPGATAVAESGEASVPSPAAPVETPSGAAPAAPADDTGKTPA